MGSCARRSWKSASTARGRDVLPPQPTAPPGRRVRSWRAAEYPGYRRGTRLLISGRISLADPTGERWRPPPFPAGTSVLGRGAESHTGSQNRLP